MIQYILPFLIYVLLPLLGGFWVYLLTILLVGGLLAFYWQAYKVKTRLDLLTVVSGALIFGFWILLKDFELMKIESFVPGNLFEVGFKLLAMSTVVPAIEEIFTRGFLIRYFAAKDWHKVEVGRFTWLSFIVTVLFFGFSHNRWLAGLVVGVILNLLFYRTKRLGNCIVAHSIANLLLGLYVIFTQSWLW
ncbi:MAG: CAAX prenyl protease-related protein [Candidatus Woesearchaeota archaeon]